MTKQPEGDVNIRIDARTHKKLKMQSARYGMPIKEVVGIMAEFGLKKTLEAVMDGK